jgi:hypothetical protein
MRKSKLAATAAFLECISALNVHTVCPRMHADDIGCAALLSECGLHFLAELPAVSQCLAFSRCGCQQLGLYHSEVYAMCSRSG